MPFPNYFYDSLVTSWFFMYKGSEIKVAVDIKKEVSCLNKYGKSINSIPIISDSCNTFSQWHEWMGNISNDTPSCYYCRKDMT